MCCVYEMILLLSDHEIIEKESESCRSSVRLPLVRGRLFQAEQGQWQGHGQIFEAGLVVGRPWAHLGPPQVLVSLLG